MITDSHKLEAIEIFLEDANILTMDKEDITTGLKVVLKQDSMSSEAQNLYELALETVYTSKGKK